MPPNLQLFTTKQYGCTGHNIFQDESLIVDLDKAVIRRITVGHDRYIHSLTVSYVPESRPAVRRGGPDGKVGDMRLEPDEYITTIEGGVTAGVIAHLEFKTNKRSYGPFGVKQTSGAFTLCATGLAPTSLVPYIGLLYFSGQYSNNGYITAIQATFAERAALPTPKRLVKYEQHTSDNPAPPAPARLSGFAKNLMSPIVILRVGSEKIEFSTNQDTLFQLPFFRAALQGQFREASEKTISMPEDDPGIISALIEFLYIGRYTYIYHRNILGGENSSDSSGTPISDSTEGSFHATVYAVASKYDCQELANIALGNFKCVLNELKGFEVMQLLKAAYTNELLLSKLDADTELVGFRQRLPELISGLYATHREEMERIVEEYPKLGSDLLYLVTRGKLA